MPQNKQRVEMVIAIICLLLVSGSVGGILATGNLPLTLWFGLVWLLVAPVCIKKIYDVKKLEQLTPCK